MVYPTLKLNSRNFEFYAARNYTNRRCVDVSEFKEDLLRFKYLKRLLGRYTADGDLQERLILNHLIIIFNVFEPIAALNMLFTRVNPEEWAALKTFLLFLNRLRNSDMPEVQVDLNIATKLNSI